MAIYSQISLVWLQSKLWRRHLGFETKLFSMRRGIVRNSPFFVMDHQSYNRGKSFSPMFNENINNSPAVVSTSYRSLCCALIRFLEIRMFRLHFSPSQSLRYLLILLRILSPIASQFPRTETIKTTRIHVRSMDDISLSPQLFLLQNVLRQEISYFNFTH